MNTTDNNKMIAEFLGYTQPHPEYPSTTYWYKEGKAPLTILSFDTDWNWLMEVVEKIISLDNVYAQKKQSILNSLSPSISKTYKEVVEFIKYYNDESKAS